MKTELQVSTIFAKLIEQAEQELLCEKQDGCTHCGVCHKTQSQLVSSKASREELRLRAAAVSTD